MSEYKIELIPKRGELERVVDMLTDVGVIEHCDTKLTIAQVVVDRPRPTTVRSVSLGTAR